ncbi:MAG TPA: hypothetical protein VFO39_04135 [Candidatus Sulfotelmatobacter sp.]|nr:hypothetical protein [Candidatus Sulfotelmatobacter sp.]
MLIGVASLFAVLCLRERRRSGTIQALAIRTGFNYLGRGVPRSLSLYGTPMERASSIWNVIDGDRPGIRIIAFDCQIGTGKGSWRRTVIAVKTDNDRAVSSNRDLTVDHSGDWTILYKPKTFALIPAGLMTVDELEARLNAIAS